MKELSIEEKAQRYDKALEAIKSLQEVNPSDEGIQNWVNENFPELKESEDEKIRERIIALVNAHGQGMYKDEMLAWLEKKGEKPQGKSALEAIKEEKVDNANKVEPRQEELTEFEKAVKQVMEEAIECGNTHNLKADAEMLLSLVHKSAWSEEDEAHIMAIDLAVNRCLGKWYCCGEKCPISEHNPWLKHLKDRVQPQNTWKPSDEQVKAVKEAACYSSVFSEKTIDNLISLSKQLKTLREE